MSSVTFGHCMRERRKNVCTLSWYWRQAIYSWPRCRSAKGSGKTTAGIGGKGRRGHFARLDFPNLLLPPPPPLLLPPLAPALAPPLAPPRPRPFIPRTSKPPRSPELAASPLFAKRFFPPKPCFASCFCLLFPLPPPEWSPLPPREDSRVGLVASSTATSKSVSSFGAVVRGAEDRSAHHISTSH